MTEPWPTRADIIRLHAWVFTDDPPELKQWKLEAAERYLIRGKIIEPKEVDQCSPSS